MRDQPRDAEFAVNSLQQLADNLFVANELMLEKFSGLTSDVGVMRAFAPWLRMTASWSTITLCKVKELWAIYSHFASEETRVLMKAVVREIDERKIERFRNAEAAHLLNRDTGNPYTPEELMASFMTIAKGDMPGFFIWQRGFFAAPPKDCVITTLLQFRDDILKRFPATPRTA